MQLALQCENERSGGVSSERSWVMTQTNSFRPYKILAALALDASNDLVLQEAVALTRGRLFVELHVVHVVVEETSAESTGEFEALERRLARAPGAIREQLERVCGNVPLQIIAHLRAGSPGRSILQTAVDIAADVIVLGSRQRSGLEQWLLGSVAEGVVRAAHCPVLIALPKDYSHAEKSLNIDPPCPDCLERRRGTHDHELWCERHRRSYNQPHVYHPSDRGRNAIMPSS
jgi:nucleotide-binding universal stress UspA family protein